LTVVGCGIARDVLPGTGGLIVFEELKCGRLPAVVFRLNASGEDYALSKCR
jgi:hypothetical protein